MPRQQRTDLQPIIYLPDTGEASRRANEAVGGGFRAFVYPDGGRGIRFRKHYDSFDAWINFLRGEGETIDHEVMDFMLAHLSFADARPRPDEQPDEAGRIPYTLFKPGCRVEMTQEEIAKGLGCSSEKVRVAIKQMKSCFIIVNWGKGWYEFDAGFVWMGNEQVRLAYQNVQEKRFAMAIK